jgi:hypothetical protein
LASFIETKEISCELKENHFWFESLGNLTTCKMHVTTSIDEKNSTISTHDELMFGLYLYTNKKIEHLPIRVVEKFPNLIAYGAGDCSIKEISRSNFIGLNKLRRLDLYKNQIEKISEDVFIDLPSLEFLMLRMKSHFTSARRKCAAVLRSRENKCLNSHFLWFF